MNILSKTIGNILNKLLAPAEDPRDGLIFTQQRVLLQKISRLYSELDELRGETGAKINQANNQLRQLDHHSLIAAKNNDLNKARLLLQRHHFAEKKMAQLIDQKKSLSQDLTRLAKIKQHLLAQAEQFLTQQDILINQHNLAGSEIAMHQLIRQTTNKWNQLDSSLEKLYQKTEWMQSRSELIDQEISVERPLSDQIDQIELNRKIEAKLQNMLPG